MPNPAIDIATQIASEGLGTLGTDMWIGPLRDDADGTDQIEVFILETSGYQPEPYFGGSDANDLRRPNVQINIRSARQNYEDGYTRAQALFTAIHKQAPATYVGWWADEPTFIEIDNKQRHRWTINVQCAYDT